MLLVAQMGAREHYEVARMASEHGRLARLITDFWNPLGAWSVDLARHTGIPLLARMAARRAEGIPNSKVVSVGSSALRSWPLRARNLRRPDHYARLMNSLARLSERTARLLDVEHTAFFGYSGESLEALCVERSRGIMTILSQVDAARLHHRILSEEQARFPDLARSAHPVPEAYYRRLQMEWSEATHVVVNSDWTRQALLAEGVPAEKIRIVPIAYRPSSPPRASGNPSKHLRVLWLARLCLAKGLPYAVEAARLLERAPVRFTFAGGADVRLSHLKWPDNARYLGPVPRPAVPDLYRNHDVLLIPTLSDGFAITQLEAMSFGLPVIATRCCGDVVVHNKSGLIVAPRSAEAIVGALLSLLDTPGMLDEMRRSAAARAQDFAPHNIWPHYERLLGACGESPV